MSRINNSRSTAITTNLPSAPVPSSSGFKGMRFCKECDNMLYPKEQIYEEGHQIARLVYDCRICGYFEKAREGDEWDNCVYKSDHNSAEAGGNFSRMFKIDRDIIKDPTL